MTKVYEHKLPVGKFELYNARPNFDFTEVSQVHGNHVLETNKSFKNNNQEADGLYCLTHEFTPMAIKTADCLPICVCGEKGVALLHAGWRGVASNIFSLENLKAIVPFYFFIGPAIAIENYEVQPDFKEHFSALDHCFTKRGQRIYFDLKGAAESLILHQFPSAQIEKSPMDTYSTPELHSFRLDKTKLRNWNIWQP